MSAEASSSTAIEIIRCPCETRGDFWNFSKSVFASAPKTQPETVFGTKHLSGLNVLALPGQRSGPAAALVLISAPPVICRRKWSYGKTVTAFSTRSPIAGSPAM